MMFKLESTYTLAAVALAVAVGAGAAAAQEKPERITMLTGSPGGTWYPISAGIAEALEDKGINTGLEQGGGGSNILNIAAQRAEAGFGLTAVNWIAKQGGGIFEEPVEGVLGLAVMFDQLEHTVVTEDSGVASYDQLKGKRMASQPVSNGSTQIFRDTLEAYGLNGEEDLEIVTRGGPGVGAKAVQDRQAIGYILTTAPPTSSVTEVSQALDVRLLPIDEQAFEKLAELNPGYSRGVIAGGTYPGIDEDVLTLADATVLMTHAGVSEDTAYWIVRAFAESLPKIREIHPAMKDLTVEKMASVKVLDLHPGAVKYYEEVGAM